MACQFKNHYTRDEARALLPQIRRWLEDLTVLRHKILEMEKALSKSLESGYDLGGGDVTSWVRGLADLKSTLREFQKREIQIKDLDRGLIDFPAFRAGQEVFLCWEKAEDDIEFWHDLNSGYAGREPL